MGGGGPVAMGSGPLWNSLLITEGRLWTVVVPHQLFCVLEVEEEFLDHFCRRMR